MNLIALTQLFEEHGLIVNPRCLAKAKTGEGALLELPFYMQHLRVSIGNGYLFMSTSTRTVNDILRQVLEETGELVMDCATFVQLCTVSDLWQYNFTIPISRFSKTPPMALIRPADDVVFELLTSTTVTAKSQWVLDFGRATGKLNLLFGLTSLGLLLKPLEEWVEHLLSELTQFVARYKALKSKCAEGRSAEIVRVLLKTPIEWIIEYK